MPPMCLEAFVKTASKSTSSPSTRPESLSSARTACPILTEPSSPRSHRNSMKRWHPASSCGEAMPKRHISSKSSPPAHSGGALALALALALELGMDGAAAEEAAAAAAGAAHSSSSLWSSSPKSVRAAEAKAVAAAEAAAAAAAGSCTPPPPPPPPQAQFYFAAAPRQRSASRSSVAETRYGPALPNRCQVAPAGALH